MSVVQGEETSQEFDYGADDGWQDGRWGLFGGEWEGEECDVLRNCGGEDVELSQLCC